MTKARKSSLAVAVAAALGGGVTTVNAVNLAPDKLGDVLIFPYYTARNGWDTLFHITNTADVTVALKVRFQEAHNSRDVLDFNVVLSPKDVWTGWVANTDSGPIFQSNDTTCTSPIKPAGGFPFSDLGYTNGNSDGGPTDAARLEEGHINVIMMGHATPGSAIDVAAKAKDCTTIDTAFEQANISMTSNQFGEPINALKGSFNLVRKDAGTAMGGEATTLANFFGSDPIEGSTDGSIAAGALGFPGNYGVSNLITAQQFPYFLLPTLNDAVPSTATVQDNTALATQQNLVDTGPFTYPVQAVSEVLMRNKVVNEWSNNPVNGVESYWVITFPTKSHFTDPGQLPTQANLATIGVPGRSIDFIGTLGPDDNDPTDDTPAAPFNEIFSSVFPGQSCDPVTFTLYDREENTIAGEGTAISPAPPVPLQSLCYETNVIGFDPDANLLESFVATSVDVSPLAPANTGWLELGLGSNTIDGGQFQGLPVVGFAFWNRDFGIAANNYGHLWDHSYTRAASSAPTP